MKIKVEPSENLTSMEKMFKGIPLNQLVTIKMIYGINGIQIIENEYRIMKIDFDLDYLFITANNQLIYHTCKNLNSPQYKILLDELTIKIQENVDDVESVDDYKPTMIKCEHCKVEFEEYSNAISECNECLKKWCSDCQVLLNMQLDRGCAGEYCNDCF